VGPDPGASRAHRLHRALRPAPLTLRRIVIMRIVFIEFVP
jgi:hypothetical protein